jgi:uncharacterized protein DUF4956
MMANRPPSGRTTPPTLWPAVARLAAYYGAVAILFVLATWAVSIVPSRDVAAAPEPLRGHGMLASGEALRRYLGWLAIGWVEAALFMIAAVLLVFPLVFVYLRTRTRAKFDHSLLQTVIVLPLAVAAILSMVHDSLALAFSLAGVVAAIRFRSNLKESRDAVYIFTAVGIGFAAGIRELGVGLLLSILFCLLELMLWRLDLAEDYTAGLRRMLMDDETHHTEAQVQLAAGPEPPVAPDADAKPQHRFRIVVGSIAAGRREVEAVLEADAKRWTFVEQSTREDGAGVLVYDVRPRKRLPADQLAAELRRQAGPAVRSVEYGDQGAAD